MPALLAAADAFDCSGQDVLVAHAAGFETGSQLGRAVHPMQYESGWHPTSTVGVFAVAAACSRLLNLTAEQTATALAISTSLAAGTKANFGTMVKSLHVGQCARGGLMAALLARKGYTANADAFDHKQGYFNLFNGPGKFHADKVLEGWGAPLDIIEPGAAYKLYPCCYSTHAAVEAALNLVREHGPFKADEIERVNSYTHAQRLPHTDRPQPKAALEAKFSVQYCVLRALIDGKVVMEHFENEAYREPAVREALPRVQAIPLQGIAFDQEDPFNALVKVTLTDGRSFESSVIYPLGRTSENPIAFEDIKAKFENCAGRVLPVSTAKAIAQGIDGMDNLKHVRDLMKQVVSATPVLIRRSA